MEEKGYWDVNWTSLFVVTACSSFVFSLVIKVLDGTFPQILLIIAVVTSGLSLLSWLLTALTLQYNRKRNTTGYPTDLNRD